MPNIIFIAPLAAGKGAISEYLQDNFNYEHISTGDLFREIIKSGSPLGKEINNIITTGALVDDKTTLEVLNQKLDTLNNDQLFILDGFPRNLNQANLLEEILVQKNINNKIKVIFLNIDYEVARKRSLGRVICPNCKKTYNIYFDKFKPQVANICDNCHTNLVKRSDDTEEIFKKRFETYLKETKDVLKYYQDKNLLYEVNANQDIDDVIKDVLKVINGDKYDKY